MWLLLLKGSNIYVFPLELALILKGEQCFPFTTSSNINGKNVFLSQPALILQYTPISGMGYALFILVSVTSHQ